ncbi:MAG: pentapeptide repeat-containing protein [Flavipsychrobacter sp.]|nr:pentapeptide repeat-containing protein [Flavipsychrobacter sp.]
MKNEDNVGLTFNKADLKTLGMAREYDGCSFLSCDLLGLSLGGVRFIECTFTGCNLSLADLNGTALQDVVFDNCKMLGMRFDLCSDFALKVHFRNCVLDNSSFFRGKFKNTRFDNCRMHEVDLTEANLQGSVFANCDLLGATTDHTDLEGANLTTAINYSIDPERNRLKKARFALAGLPGLLHKYGIDVE